MFHTMDFVPSISTGVVGWERVITAWGWASVMGGEKFFWASVVSLGFCHFALSFSLFLIFIILSLVFL